jgi:diguanylate cyclase (GGDEF)-like protein
MATEPGTTRPVVQKVLLSTTLVGMAVVQAVSLAFFQSKPVISNGCSAAVAFVAGLCCLWRCAQLRRRERPAWIWIAVGLFLWALAQAIFTWMGGNNWDVEAVADISDLLFFEAEIPFLLAITNTYDAESRRGALYVNLVQAAVASGLTYLRIFQMPAAAADSAVALYSIYWAECLLLAVAASVRLFTWSTEEERRRNRLLCAMLWIYLPIEVFLDYPGASWHAPADTLVGMMWRLPKGGMFELLWSVPFVYMGLQALRAPISQEFVRRRSLHNKQALLLRSLFPMVITCAVFVLAVSVARQHFYIGVGSILLLLIVQGFHSGVIQVGYLVAQATLLSKEKELRAANLELERQSMLDPLTAIPNRRYFGDAFEKEWKRAQRKNEYISILMLDLDFFKGINDAHGHVYGDHSLVEIAKAIGMELQRGVDVVARYGGEEFIVLLPDTDLEGAGAVAAGLQNVIARLKIVNKASPFDEQLTVSIGIAVTRPSAAMSRGELIARADRALYRAKREGRNRICWDDEFVSSGVAGSNADDNIY